MPNYFKVRGQEGISRRSMLALCAAVPAIGAQADNDPLHLLKATHPRLIVTDADIDRIRILIRDSAVARRVYGDLEKECDRLLSIPPTEYKLNGPRLQTQTRRALDRIMTLSLMFRVSGRDPWLRRAVMELNAVANFKDWNPSRFIETAELTQAFALGYDWLYNSLSTEERAWMRDAIVTHSFDQALPTYQKQTWWARERLNWNVVCNSAMAMGALAIGDEAHDKATEVLKGALESIPRGLASFGADGSWPEGPFYGESATRYACLFFASLETALGQDYGMSGFHGIDRAGRFRMYSTGPSGKFANFGDSPEDAGLAPEMFWLAKRFNMPAYTWSEQRQLEKKSTPDAMDLAWFDRDARPPTAPAWPLEAVFHSTGLATFRSSWEDPNALFLALKAGDSKAPHAHFDLGAFIFDAGGIRWAADLAVDDAPAAAPQRSSMYRIRTEAHNTLLIEAENQDPRADARIVRQDSSADLNWVQIDLTKTSTKLRQWTRRAGIAQKQAVLIQDSIRAEQPLDVMWSMTTDVDFSIDGALATFHKNGWNMAAEIRTPRHAVFDTAPVKSPAGNYKRLIVRLLDKVTELDLNVVLTPWRDGQPKPKITAQFPA